MCADLPLGPKPVLQIDPRARILIAGQAPGRRAHASGIPFDDVSGERLRAWLGIDRASFYDAARVAIVPMAFCFPGTGRGGDLPPPPLCARTWRRRLLALLPEIGLTVLLGRYALDWHLGATAANLTETVADCREAVGADFVLMVDVQYAWPDADTALRTLRDWEPLDVYFIETPLPVDDLAGMARLAEESPVDIASGEWLSTRHEFADLMDHGRVHVAQPDIGRVGGITEALRVCEMAAERGRRIVPHCWKTGIGIAASAHLAAVTPHCPFIEFLPAELTDSQLRQDLVKDDLQIIDGKVAVPDQPGLGIELDMDALRRFEQA